MSGWQLAVGGWLARWRSGGGELKKSNKDMRIHTAPQSYTGQTVALLCFLLFLFFLFFLSVSVLSILMDLSGD